MHVPLLSYSTYMNKTAQNKKVLATHCSVQRFHCVLSRSTVIQRQNQNRCNHKTAVSLTATCKMYSWLYSCLSQYTLAQWISIPSVCGRCSSSVVVQLSIPVVADKQTRSTYVVAVGGGSEHEHITHKWNTVMYCCNDHAFCNCFCYCC